MIAVTAETFFSMYIEIANTHLSGDLNDEDGAGGVQRHVHQVVTPGFKTSEKMIQTKSGDAERSVAAVRTTFR